MSAALYWLSASVLTITSAPSFSDASSPAWKPCASPLLFVSRTTWSTPWRARDLDRAVGRAVVDHEPLDLVEALDLAREVGKRDRERLLLVQAGNLDDQLHRQGASRLRKLARLIIAQGPESRRGRPCPCRRPAPTPRGKRNRRTIRARASRALPGARSRCPPTPSPLWAFVGAVRRWRSSGSSPGSRTRTTTATTRCSGARSCCRRPAAELRGLPRADRASAGGRVRRRAVAARPGRRPA